MGTASFSNSANTLMDYQTRQVGLDYNFSKRTRAYGYIGSSVNNAATATTSLGVATKDQSQTMVGVRHDF
jgi:predicted porin